MRIALVGPAYPYKGGGAQHTTELAHRLAAEGHDVVIESWRAQYPKLLYPGTQTVTGPEGVPFPATRRELSWRRPDGWWRLGRRLALSHDAVVLAVLSPIQVPAYLTVLAALRRARGGDGAGPRTVALCHNVLPHEQRRFDAPLMRRLLGTVDAVLAHSPEQASLARELAPRTPAHAAALPPFQLLRGPTDGPADIAVESPADDEAEGADGAVDGAVDGATSPMPGWTPRRHLLFFGIVRPYKGLDVLLRALAQGPPGVALTVAGEFWGGLAETQRLIDELGLSGRVDLRPGYVPAEEVPALFARADALVLPYRSATASQHVWIAFEHGIPVIATRAGALADHVRDGVDGIVAAPDDVTALAKALDRFYAPGEPERLRAGVGAVDPTPLWLTYLSTLLTAVAPSPTSLRHPL